MKFKKCLLFILGCTLISGVQAKTLLVFGDSLSAAYNLRQQEGWVSLLTEELKQTHPDIEVVNASISGETTQGGLARLPKLLQTHQPNWIILELGANDGLRGYPIAQMQQNLAKMIDLSKQIQAQPLLIGNRLPSNYGATYTNLFFNSYKELAEQRTVAYVPFMLENVALEKSLMQNDGLHPNAEGQKSVYKHLKSAIFQLISP